MTKLTPTQAKKIESSLIAWRRKLGIRTSDLPVDAFLIEDQDWTSTADPITDILEYMHILLTRHTK